jgi:hypothetical protein
MHFHALKLPVLNVMADEMSMSIIVIKLINALVSNIYSALMVKFLRMHVTQCVFDVAALSAFSLDRASRRRCRIALRARRCLRSSCLRYRCRHDCDAATSDVERGRTPVVCEVA